LKRFFFLIVVIVIVLNQNVSAEPEENDFGIVNAWYNGHEATVKNIQLKVGEPAEIRVSVHSKIDCHVFVELTNPLKTVPYDIVSGPSELDKTIDNYDVKSGWSENYTWVITPNAEWTSGTAPINIFVQFSKSYDDDRIVEFTIANPYILDEHYSGPAPTPTAIPSSTDQPSSKGSPGFGALAALAGTALVVMWRRRRI
jgi:sarcinarray family protein